LKVSKVASLFSIAKPATGLELIQRSGESSQQKDPAQKKDDADTDEQLPGPGIRYFIRCSFACLL
jgi:hypothetical protein